jgi:predicted RNase H-like HicB family nuclease
MSESTFTVEWSVEDLILYACAVELPSVVTQGDTTTQAFAEPRYAVRKQYD